MSNRSPSVWIVASALACSAPAAVARPDEPAPPPADAAWNGAPTGREWTASVEPRLWFPALRGDISLRNGSTFQIEDVGMDEVHAAPAGEFSLRADRWKFSFSGFSFGFDDTDRSAVPIDGAMFDVDAGDRVSFDITYSAFKLTAGYALDPFIRDDDAGVAVWLDLYAGVQVYHLDLDFGPDGADGISIGKTWAEPLAGVGLNIALPHGFEVSCVIDAGATLGGGTGFAWDITPRFRWFVMENRAVALEIGFRHVQADLIDGSGDDPFEFDASLAGLFGSVLIRF